MLVETGCTVNLTAVSRRLHTVLSPYRRDRERTSTASTILTTMAPPTLADYDRHFDTRVPLITRLTEKISTAEQVDLVQREYH